MNKDASMGKGSNINFYFLKSGGNLDEKEWKEMIPNLRLKAVWKGIWDTNRKALKVSM